MKEQKCFVQSSNALIYRVNTCELYRKTQFDQNLTLSRRKQLTIYEHGEGFFNLGPPKTNRRDTAKLGCTWSNDYTSRNFLTQLRQKKNKNNLWKMLQLFISCLFFVQQRTVRKKMFWNVCVKLSISVFNLNEKVARCTCLGSQPRNKGVWVAYI